VRTGRRSWPIGLSNSARGGVRGCLIEGAPLRGAATTDLLDPVSLAPPDAQLSRGAGFLLFHLSGLNAKPIPTSEQCV
jgi:hypothetical protein